MAISPTLTTGRYFPEFFPNGRLLSISFINTRTAGNGSASESAPRGNRESQVGQTYGIMAPDLDSTEERQLVTRLAHGRVHPLYLLPTSY